MAMFAPDAQDGLSRRSTEMKAAKANEGDLACPQCGHSNPPQSDYCWECRYDFVPDGRPKKPIPPPYSQSAPNAPAKRQGPSIAMFALQLLASALIVGGSWALLSWMFPSMGVIIFAAGWGIALVAVLASEGNLPDMDPNAKYYSWNPFDFEDDRNRRIRNAHQMLFLPRVVVKTIRTGRAVLFR